MKAEVTDGEMQSALKETMQARSYLASPQPMLEITKDYHCCGAAVGTERAHRP